MSAQLRLPMSPLPHCAGEPAFHPLALPECQYELRFQTPEAAEDWHATTRRLASTEPRQ